MVVVLVESTEVPHELCTDPMQTTTVTVANAKKFGKMEPDLLESLLILSCS